MNSGNNLCEPKTSRNRISQTLHTTKARSSRRKPFVPLRDLLDRKHDDRVNEYLDKMKGLTIDEIVNTSILNKASGEAGRTTPDRQNKQSQ